VKKGRANAYALLAATVAIYQSAQDALSFCIKSIKIRTEELRDDPNEAVSVSPNAVYCTILPWKPRTLTLINIAQDDDAMHMHALEVHADLICCYKILFGLTDLQASEFFEKATLPITRVHSYKLYKKHSSSTV